MQLTLFSFQWSISGHEHLKLIFDFSVWVLKAHPDDGLKVTLVVKIFFRLNCRIPCHSKAHLESVATRLRGYAATELHG